MSDTTTLTAARGTLLSIALRLTSFLLSQLTVRFVSAAALGKASIPLELLLSTALFVGREGFRLALTKEIGSGEDGDGDDRNRHGGVADTMKKEKQQRDQQITNVSWLSVPTGAILALLALLVHLHKCNTNNNTHSDDTQDEYYALLDYKLAGLLYCLASFIESLSEPLVIRCLQQMDVTTKAKAEGAALIMKSMSCFGCLYLTRTKWFVNSIILLMGGYSERGTSSSSGGGGANFAVTAFGISQLVYALVFTIIMYRKARSSMGGIRWPKKVQSSMSNPYRENATIREKTPTATLTPNFDLHAIYMVFIFTLQGLFKHALTEADKIVLSALAGSYDQGVYALAASYGGLAARLLLQPMEENARLLFSRQGALVAKCIDIAAGHDKDNEKESKLAVFNLLKELEDTYFFLIKVVLYIGFLFAAIATNYTSVLLRVLAGSRWGTNSEASAALSAFCVYTAFLALNGTTEAFVYGVARSGNDVGRIGIAHAVIGGIFALIAPGLVREQGAVGLVAANCISMAMRSMYSLHYAQGYFAKAGKRNSPTGVLLRILPHRMAVMAFIISFAITRTSRIYGYDAQIAAGGSWIVAGARHIAVGVCAIVTVVTSLWLEKDIRTPIINLINRKAEERLNRK
mmetsp:Transcript_1504/g.3189  ORF Transcript_1504/g.3189 Transcript_1504/m.3189 type:complete len:632 (-) Transcript_1504:142-2037(-)|eukprot:CAMPEP_0172306746 /NCGR_PEP_ID=MMETSP1058-20130122/7755_1 /TAXON_ID=83371 /ORGANISM="Detonula confervacea, Strain CCMP 353" /LENGTH=631 /DNA_ID=CAMNT_0013018727 /DNA_START=29 /DNA_END=1924 /DNA_ORIENTATION=+